MKFNLFALAGALVFSGCTTVYEPKPPKYLPQPKGEWRSINQSGFNPYTVSDGRTIGMPLYRFEHQEKRIADLEAQISKLQADINVSQQKLKKFYAENPELGKVVDETIDNPNNPAIELPEPVSKSESLPSKTIEIVPIGNIDDDVSLEQESDADNQGSKDELNDTIFPDEYYEDDEDDFSNAKSLNAKEDKKKIDPVLLADLGYDVTDLSFSFNF